MSDNQVCLTSGENIETEQQLAKKKKKSHQAKITTTQAAHALPFFNSFASCVSFRGSSKQMLECLLSVHRRAGRWLGHQPLWFWTRGLAAVQWPLVPFSPLGGWEVFRAASGTSASSSELLSMSLRTSLHTWRGNGNWWEALKTDYTHLQLQQASSAWKKLLSIKKKKKKKKATKHPGVVRSPDLLKRSSPLGDVNKWISDLLVTGVPLACQESAH